MQDVTEKQKAIFVRFNLTNYDDLKLYEDFKHYTAKFPGVSDVQCLKKLIREYFTMEPKMAIEEEVDEIKEIQPIDETPHVYDDINTANIFMRGQVWHWRDPLLGKKDFGKQIHKGEGLLRYSRFVIIMQDPNTITGTALCIPISGHYNDPYDLEIEIISNSGRNKSYARTRFLYPVDVNQLDNYICTLTSETMLNLNIRLSKLLIQHSLLNIIEQYIYSVYDKTKIFKLMDISILDDNRNLLPDIPDDITENFVDADDISDNDDDVIPVETESSKPEKSTIELGKYESLIVFAIGHERLSVDDVSSFFGVSKNTASKYITKLYEDKIVGKKYKSYPRKVLINNISDLPDNIFDMFIDTKIITTVLEKKMKNEKIDYTEFINLNSPVFSKNCDKKWTDEYIKEFLDVIDKNGYDVTAKKYNMTKSTVTTYTYRLRKNLNPTAYTKSNSENYNDDKEINPTIIEATIYSISEYIKYLASTEKVYNRFLRGKKKSGQQQSVNFYDNIKNSVYKSLMNLLCVETTDGKSSLTNSDALHEYTGTVKFIMEFYKNNINKGALYLEYEIPINFKINSAWNKLLLGCLNMSMSRKINCDQLSQYIINKLNKK